MRDAVVVGCGRSGTSLAAGLLAASGWNAGDDLLPPDEGGPKGFFESRAINELNERLLAPYEDSFRCLEGYSRPLRDGERWLAVLPDGVEVEAPAGAGEAMRAVMPGSPWCCKDPRFGYTLPAWRPLFGDALFVCVFRHPLATATSIARQVRYGDLTMDVETALELWIAIYTRLLKRESAEGDWLFVHYDQLLDADGLARLGAAAGAPLDSSVADRSLRHARADEPAPADTAALYGELCAAAGHAP